MEKITIKLSEFRKIIREEIATSKNINEAKEETADFKVVRWDWRTSPPKALQKALDQGYTQVHDVETGDNENCFVMTKTPITYSKAQKLYNKYDEELNTKLNKNENINEEKDETAIIQVGDWNYKDKYYKAPISLIKEFKNKVGDGKGKKMEKAWDWWVEQIDNKKIKRLTQINTNDETKFFLDFNDPDTSEWKF